MTLSGTATRELDGYLNNGGLLRQVDEHTLSPAIGGNPDRVQNLSGGVIELTVVFTVATSVTVVNAGAIESSGQAALADFANVGGTIDVQAGRLNLAGHGESTGGHLNVEAGALLEITRDLIGNGTQEWTGLYTGSGGGRVHFSVGVMLLHGATFDFPGDLFHWQGGRIYANAGTPLVNLGQIALSGAATKELDGVIQNSGLLRQLGEHLLSYAAGGQPDQVQNLSGGLMELTGIFTTTASLTVVNEGTVESSGQAALADFDQAGGTVDVQAGWLNLAGHGDSSGGHFNVAAGALLETSRDLISNGFRECRSVRYPGRRRPAADRRSGRHARAY